MNQKNIYILAIESSCDDTSAAITCNETLLSNIIAGQQIHMEYGGVVPELASRAHQQNIVPVTDAAIRHANISKKDLSAIAFTRGPGLLGSLMVGVSFAKALALALNLPIIEVDHMQAHILANFIQEPNAIKSTPNFPFLCLTVSGGHTQLTIIEDHLSYRIIGKTIDDAAGETFDKAAKILGLQYPGGPIIDKLASTGNPSAFTFAKPNIAAFDFSFSGLKTSFLYFIRDMLKTDPDFILNNLNDLAASIQNSIISILIKKTIAAAKQNGINQIAIAGGVSANSALRIAMQKACDDNKMQLFIPSFSYTTDNAAMIGITAYYKYLRNEFASQMVSPYSTKKT